MARERRTYSDEFKQKMVELIREYELTPSALSSWINKYNSTDSFNIDDNRKKNLSNFIKKFNA